jgi:hypothetical protein
LEHRINETDGKLKVVKEVSEAVPDRERHDGSVSVCQGTDGQVGKVVVHAENRPVKLQKGIIYLLHRDIRKIVADSGSGG